MDFANSVYFKPIIADNGWVILDNHTANDRTLLCWFSPARDSICLAIFHNKEPVTDIGLNVNKSSWGYISFYIKDIKSESEAADLFDLYSGDIEGENFWWEGFD